MHKSVQGIFFTDMMGEVLQVGYKNICSSDAGDSDHGCLGENYCPPKCTCTGTIVQCSRAKFTEIPRGLPLETSEL